MILTTPGVISFVSCGRYPATISDEEIEAVRRVASRGESQPWRFLATGTAVRIQSGPLAGVSGMLVSSPESRRLIVSIEILQRSVATVLDDDTQLHILSRERSEMVQAVGA